MCGDIILDKKEVCTKCLNDLPYVTGETCQRCGAALDRCNCKVGDFAFFQNIAPFYYEKSAKQAVIRMKFHNKPQLCKFMSDVMYNYICVKYKDITFDCITFVPSDRLKMLRKGFNQSELLAKRISTHMKVPLDNLLTKKFSFVSQKNKRKERRRKDVHGLYNSNKSVKDETILLIDDILTTGSTASECARILKKAGAKRVYCATFAITCKK